jgi:hypothetical protein
MQASHYIKKSNFLDILVRKKVHKKLAALNKNVTVYMLSRRIWTKRLGVHRPKYKRIYQ